MKKTILMIAACAVFAACNSGQSEKEREKADSIAAAHAADSMLQAASKDTLSTDSVKADSVTADTAK